MNINTKPENAQVETPANASDEAGIFFPDAAALAGIAAEYFPEFNEEFRQPPHPSTPIVATPSPIRLPEGASSVAYSFLDSRQIFSEISSSENIAGIAPVAGFDQSGWNHDSYGISFDPVVVPALDVKHEIFDVAAIRKDFPILAERVNNRPLIWLDNAATTQKPKSVINRLNYFYEHENSNVHRAAHTLASRSTDAYEAAREKIARFLNASSSKEIVFVRGTTEGINLVSQTWGRQNLHNGDEIVLSHLEHHANIVPWQLIAAETGAKLRIIPVDDSGQILTSELSRILSSRTKLVSITQVSNALGTITPIDEIVGIAHRYGAKVLVDGAQSIPHMKIDAQAADMDFFVFSGHKLYGPTGIGVLYGKEELLNSLPPYQGGGNMIADVAFERTVYQPAPLKFEAGTGNIADAIGLGGAIDYVNSLGIERIAHYEHELLDYATSALVQIPGLHLVGTAKDKASVLSFVLDGFTTEEVGKALSAEGIAVRSGHHCAQPILRRFGLESTVRPSIAFYNTRDEIDALADVLRHLKSNYR